jgi:hypothetical protein
MHSLNVGVVCPLREHTVLSLFISIIQRISLSRRNLIFKHILGYGPPDFLWQSHTRYCGLLCFSTCKNKLCCTSNRLIYCVIFIVYKQSTIVAADSIRHAGRKLQTRVLVLKYKINFTMHRATDNMINRKRKVQTVN